MLEGPSGKNDALRGEICYGAKIHIEGMDLAVDPCLPHSPGNELGILGSEIKNQNFLRIKIIFHAFTPPGNWELPW